MEKSFATIVQTEIGPIDDGNFWGTLRKAKEHGWEQIYYEYPMPIHTHDNALQISPLDKVYRSPSGKVYHHSAAFNIWMGYSTEEEYTEPLYPTKDEHSSLCRLYQIRKVNA